MPTLGEISKIIYSSEPEQEPIKPNYTDFTNSSYGIISKVAYLIGVDRRHFENEHEPPKIEVYQQLDKDKNARIMRNLCRIRTAIEKNYGKIANEMRYNVKNLHTLPDYVPTECINELQQDGISIIKSNYKLNQYIIDINRHITNRINNCKEIFPIWIKWAYIRNLFIMPNGTSEAGIKAAGEEYNMYKNSYPYQVYINWASINRGNILYSDKKFVTILYEENNDYFDDMSKVTDAGNVAKSGIYRFLDRSEKCAVVVDCENSDPYKLYATLNNLDQEALLSKISKIILYDDVHTSSAWSILEQFTEIPIEHIVIERIKENKSLVDMRLSTGTCIEYYENHVDSFILVSSDSDYWALISAMPKINFLVLVESGKCSPAIKNALVSEGITYCYIDDFCTGNSEQLKVSILLTEIRQAIDRSFRLNVNELLANAYTASRANLSDAEKRQFYNRYIKPMKIVIDANGDASVELGS